MHFRNAVGVKAVELIDALGVEGMSSDESDHELAAGAPSYVVSELRWRSPALSTWLRMFDSLHLRIRYKEGVNATAGSWPHYRVDGCKESKRHPVRGLPRNCYSATLETDEFRRHWLDQINEDIDLQVPTALHK